VIDVDFYTAMHAACLYHPDVLLAAYGNWHYFQCIDIRRGGCSGTGFGASQAHFGQLLLVKCGWVSADLARTVGGFNPQLRAMEYWDFWLEGMRTGA
jgi:hypothetical protein